MGPFAAGSVVLVRFPFSDLSESKLRPAVVLAEAGYQDWVTVQITSNPLRGYRVIRLTDTSFATGSLRRVSYALPAKLFTANQNLIVRQLGVLEADVFTEIVEEVIHILQASLIT